ncbi:hypothetical protein ACG873_02000 [Mesorhizobium sp. AaZ16]|uniref:hypothetical protein n=1 Tax=Mesorhizobium sp. AaZ16 TaxID=3402289 RepID=UPI00374F2648
METSLADPDSPTGLHTIKGDAGAATLDNMLALADRLAFIKKLDLPRDLLSAAGKTWIDQIVRRVGAEKASEMRRHASRRQLGLYTVFLMMREAQIIDGMVDLLVETIHKIGVRSKRKVVAGIARDIEKVYGKERLLIDIAGAAIEAPGGRVCDVIFPVAGKEKLAAIVKEYRAKGTLERRIYQVMRGSYAGHYRRILPKLLSVLEFRSNNAVHRPVLGRWTGSGGPSKPDAALCRGTGCRSKGSFRRNGAARSSERMGESTGSAMSFASSASCATASGPRKSG